MLNISCLSIWLWLMASGDYLFYCVNYNLRSSFATQIFRQHDGEKKTTVCYTTVPLFPRSAFPLVCLASARNATCIDSLWRAAPDSGCIEFVNSWSPPASSKKRKIDIAIYRVRQSESTDPVKERGQQLCTDVRLITPDTRDKAMNVGSKTVVLVSMGGAGDKWQHSFQRKQRKHLRVAGVRRYRQEWDDCSLITGSIHHAVASTAFIAKSWGKQTKLCAMDPNHMQNQINQSTFICRALNHNQRRQLD